MSETPPHEEAGTPERTGTVHMQMSGEWDPQLAGLRGTSCCGGHRWLVRMN